eukprot:CAMPEP_0202069290 /NCGR_PEP_ID=MMETSP0964-20121228/385_1 /ASSEMBLY_ACC=CAM_ASM_000500 /TAXON_ID=4773 /ORGANISM="Schizochytrium aggregatum, Strain ATCC28209" /LENGTH=388 /DNA_ID=CAMNT_0048636037 /DNA_START=13 /DNA_END=1179 /DNA_ORIENTATION=-
MGQTPSGEERPAQAQAEQQHIQQQQQQQQQQHQRQQASTMHTNQQPAPAAEHGGLDAAERGTAAPHHQGLKDKVTTQAANLAQHKLGGGQHTAAGAPAPGVPATGVPATGATTGADPMHHQNQYAPATHSHQPHSAAGAAGAAATTAATKHAHDHRHSGHAGRRYTDGSTTMSRNTGRHPQRWMSPIFLDERATAPEQVKGALKRLLWGRVVQLALLAISWACATVFVDRVKSANLDSPNPINWGLACGVLAFFCSLIHLILVVLCIALKPKRGLLSLTAYSGAVIDTLFMFLTVSAFTALAVSAFLSPKLAAAAAMMCLAWITYLFTGPLSWLLVADRHHLFPAKAKAGTHDPLDNDHHHQTTTTTDNKGATHANHPHEPHANVARV